MIYKIWHNLQISNRDNVQTEWVWPQDYHVDEYYSYNNTRMGNELSPIIKLPLFKLTKEAYHTDYLELSGVSSFMVVSERMFEKMTILKLPEISILDIEVSEKKYKAIHFNTDQTDSFIDWEESYFNVRENQKELENSEVKFLNSKDRNEKGRKLSDTSGGRKKYIVTKIKLRKLEFDLFYSRNPQLGIFCSQKFKNLIEYEGFLGFRFQKIV